MIAEQVELTSGPSGLARLSFGSSRVNGSLQLRFEARESKTALTKCEQELPLRIVRAFPLEDGASLVHLHNLSGGVLGGDRLRLDVEVGPGANAQLTSTGATRIYRSRAQSSVAAQTTQFRVAQGALLEYLPDQMIPFAGSRYRQETTIDLRDEAGLFWWETIAPGREARDEVFAYESLHLKTSISALGKPIALEHMYIEPAKRSTFSLARLGPYRYFSTFYICRVGVEPARWLELEKQLAGLAEQMSRPSEIVWGISTLGAHGLVIRGLSVRCWEITRQLPNFWRFAKRFLYARGAALPRKIY